ncbi:MAG: hypothetical protein FJX74_06565, partial [Armatimonadetes bacterium]|nr:hypothetical protein [Armatimonadota bacterium]
MQYRPKLWIVLLLLLLVSAFEIGFQPIRFIRSGQTLEATFDFDLGESAGADDEALAARVPEIETKLDAAGLKALKDVRFLNPTTLRVVTVVLEETDRAADQGLALSAVQEEFKNAKLAEGGLADAEALPGLVKRFGPIGIFRPTPQVQLGLDLQGGAHVVLQCKPSTEMTFAAPEDRPLYSDEVPTEETKEPDAKAGEEKGDTKGAKAPEGVWKPKYSQETLLAEAEKVLEQAGVEHFEVTAPAPYRLLVRTQSTSEETVA